MKLQKPIRVAFLGKSASRGGSQRELSCIVKYLDKSRFEPMVLLPEGGDLLDDFKRGAATQVYSEQIYSESNETREDGHPEPACATPAKEGARVIPATSVK